MVNSNGLSVLTAPANAYGPASNSAFSVADNFTVGAGGWNVSSFDFYGYQTQTGTGVYTFTSVTWSVIAGTDVNSGSVVASGTTTATNGGLVGYRVLSTDQTNQQRAIFRIGADVTDFSLDAGSYFLTWQLAGTSESGPFTPPVVGSLGNGNALRAPTGGAYSPLTDTGSNQSYDLPFTINGTPQAVGDVPEPATWGMMLLGFGVVGGAMRRRRGKVLAVTLA